MTWTAPRTWTTGEYVTAAQLNTHLRDNMTEVRAAKITRVGILTTPNIPNAAWTTLEWEFETGNTAGAWVSTWNPSRLKPTTPGWYTVTAKVRWSGNVNGLRGVRLLANGADVWDRHVIGAVNTSQDTSCTDGFYFDGNDYIEVQAYQSSGGDLALSDVEDVVTSCYIAFDGA